MRALDSYFDVSRSGSTIRREVLSGLTIVFISGLLFVALSLLGVREPIDKWDLALVAILLFFFMVLFDTVGTLAGVGKQAGFLREDGTIPRAPSQMSTLVTPCADPAEKESSASAPQNAPIFFLNACILASIIVSMIIMDFFVART